jgi:hypothetical protein
MVVVAVLGWVLTEWVGFKFLMAIAAVGTAVWVLLSLVLMVGYFVRVRRLARRFWESGAAGSDQDARRRLATDIITQDLAGRRFVIRPGPAAAHEGLSNLIPLGAFASTPYMANLWREP